MKYYAAINKYGFSNTWTVYVFSSRAARDKFLTENDSNLSARAIKKREVTNYVDGEPKPFSGQYYCIDKYHEDEERGIVGTVAIVPNGAYSSNTERLF
jgi:alkyl hydroperoxide reductase subunit AhpF